LSGIFTGDPHVSERIATADKIIMKDKVEIFLFILMNEYAVATI
jgi:hypothetical protein